MATVDSLLIKIQADLGDLRKELNKSKQLTSRAGRDMSSGLDKIKIAGANLTNQFNLLKTAIVGAGFGFLGFQVIRANREMEDLKITDAGVRNTFTLQRKRVVVVGILTALGVLVLHSTGALSQINKRTPSISIQSTHFTFTFQHVVMTRA